MTMFISPPGHEGRMRIAYLSGPCNAPAVYDEWRNSNEPDYFGSNYMKQFIQLCDDLDAETYVITNLQGQRSACRRGRFIFENHPNPDGLAGVKYHLAFLCWFARVIPRIVRFRPDVLLLTDNSAHWFMLFFVRLFRIPILPSLHSVPWRKFGKRKLSSRILWQLNRFLIFKSLKTIIVTSSDIQRQIVQLLGKKKASQINFIRHFPSYSKSQFESLPSPTLAPRPPFRVFFAGRIEDDKGIYDLLEVAKRLNKYRKGEFCFDICGEGSELGKFRRIIAELQLEDVVCCHGYCNPRKFTPLLACSHAWIVPTRSECQPGYEMVCGEAILAGRPLVTSAVCPGLEDVREAAVEVQPDNPDQYYQAILKLNDDPDFYLRKQQACAGMQTPFYSFEQSWYCKLKGALTRYAVSPAHSGQRT